MRSILKKQQSLEKDAIRSNSFDTRQGNAPHIFHMQFKGDPYQQRVLQSNGQFTLPEDSLARTITSTSKHSDSGAGSKNNSLSLIQYRPNNRPDRFLDSLKRQILIAPSNAVMKLEMTLQESMMTSDALSTTSTATTIAMSPVHRKRISLLPSISFSDRKGSSPKIAETIVSKLVSQQCTPEQQSKIKLTEESKPKLFQRRLPKHQHTQGLRLKNPLQLRLSEFPIREIPSGFLPMISDTLEMKMGAVDTRQIIQSYQRPHEQEQIITNTTSSMNTQSTQPHEELVFSDSNKYESLLSYYDKKYERSYQSDNPQLSLIDPSKKRFGFVSKSTKNQEKLYRKKCLSCFDTDFQPWDAFDTTSERFFTFDDDSS